jgi:bacterioferritin-associated ferredoxin
MYVCVCHCVREQNVREFLQNNEKASLRQVQKACLAGTSCGSCLEYLVKIHKEEEAKKRQLMSNDRGEKESLDLLR